MERLRLAIVIAICAFIYSPSGHCLESNNKDLSQDEIRLSELISRDDTLEADECAWQSWKELIEQELETEKQLLERRLEKCTTMVKDKYRFPQKTVTIAFTITENNRSVSQISHAGSAGIYHVINSLEGKREIDFPRGSTNRYADVTVQCTVKNGSAHFQIQHIHLHGRPKQFYAEIRGY